MIQLLRSIRYVRMIRNYDLEREPDIYKIRKLVKPGDTVIDIGAGIGLYSYNMSKAVGPTGRVIACEPWPKSFDVLRRNMKGLGCKNVVELPYAMSDKYGSGAMHIPKGRNHYFACLERGPQVGVPVVVRTFDTVMMSLTHASFVKVDTEGYEAAILRGAHEFLQDTNAVWLVEVNKAWWDIRETFAKYGYGNLEADTENCFFAKREEIPRIRRLFNG